MALATQAKEDFDLAEANCAEGGRVAPVPKPLKKQLFGIIIHRLRKISNVKDRRQTLRGNLCSIAHNLDQVGSGKHLSQVDWKRKRELLETTAGIATGYWPLQRQPSI